MNWYKVKNDLLLATSSEFFYKIVGYLILVILTRYLAKDQMGQFFFAASLAAFFVLSVFIEAMSLHYAVPDVKAFPTLRRTCSSA